MFKNYLRGIEGIATYPMFSLLIFFLFFIAVFVWMWKADRNEMEEISKLPLMDNENSNNS